VPRTRVKSQKEKKENDNGQVGGSQGKGQELPASMPTATPTEQRQYPASSSDVPSPSPKRCSSTPIDTITTASSLPILDNAVPITDFSLQDHGYQTSVDVMSPYSLNYPPLNLYAPLMNGNLPLDTFFEAMTPCSIPSDPQFHEHHHHHHQQQQQQQQQCFQQDLPSFADDQVPPGTYTSPSDTATTSNRPSWTVPTSCFVPYVTLFFDRLYPVFPVLERDSLPSEESVDDASHQGWDRYALHAALAAAVTIQLNIVGSQHDDFPSMPSASSPSPSSPPSPSSTRGGNEFYTSDFWTSHALRARQQWDFMSDPDEATVMTSFLLFEYYGNKNHSQKAWYYLREAIGFVLAMGLDDPETYVGLESRVAQRRCRLFWLLFITER
jgi:hypothetical protein